MFKASSFFVFLFSVLFFASCTWGKQDFVSTRSDSSTPASESVVSVGQNTSSTSQEINTKTFRETVSYRVDHGKHQVTTTFVIWVDADSAIVSVDAEMERGDRESSMYHSRFNSAISSKVIWKKISDISLDAVGWASDTTEAFYKVVTSL